MMLRLLMCLLTMALYGDIVRKDEIQIIGIECRTSNDPSQGMVDIPNLWARFFAEDIQNQVPNKASCDLIALYCDYESDYTQAYTIVIGCPVTHVDEIPHGMIHKTIPAGHYKEYNAIGEHPQAVISTWQAIWEDKSLKRTYTGDYELYSDKFFSTPKQVDIFIAVE